MAEGTAEKAEGTKESQEKSPDQIAQDEAATKLLNEIDAEDKAEAEKKAKGDDTEDADKETTPGKTPDADKEPDASGSQPDAHPKGKRGFKRRQARLVKQREEARTERDDNAQKLADKDEEAKLLRLKIEQLEGRGKPLVAPDPEKFDGGEIDPDFVKAKGEYDDARIERMVSEKVQQATKRTGDQITAKDQADALTKKQEKHWADADELGVKDYDAKEEELIKTLGADMVTNIIDYFPDESHILVYHLGTNSKEAERIGELLDNRATLVQGVAQLGRILEKISPKGSKTSIKPDPDTEPENRGGQSPQEGLQLRLERMRQDVADGKSTMAKVLAFKKQAKERGIALV